VQLIVCDWLLASRSEVWLRRHHASRDSAAQTHDDHDCYDCTGVDDDAVDLPSELAGYQRDLTSLRHLAHTLRAAVPRVCRLSTPITSHCVCVCERVREREITTLCLYLALRARLVQHSDDVLAGLSCVVPPCAVACLSAVQSSPVVSAGADTAAVRARCWLQSGQGAGCLDTAI